MPTGPSSSASSSAASTLRTGRANLRNASVTVSLFLTPLCHLAAELFKCRLVRRRRQLLRGGGGKGQSQKRFSNFFSFFA